MTKLTEGVVLRAAISMGYTAPEARNLWKLGTEYDHRVLVEDAQFVGFDLELARTHDRMWQDAVRNNSVLQERLFLQNMGCANNPNEEGKDNGS